MGVCNIILSQFKYILKICNLNTFAYYIIHLTLLTLNKLNNLDLDLLYYRCTIRFKLLVCPYFNNGRRSYLVSTCIVHVLCIIHCLGACTYVHMCVYYLNGITIMSNICDHTDISTCTYYFMVKYMRYFIACVVV